MNIDEFLSMRYKPRKKPSLTEHYIQCACVQWFRYEYPAFLIFAVPNAARRSQAVAKIMKDEGMLAGVADLILIAHNQILFLEMKTAKGRQQDTQKAFQQNVERLGFEYAVCHSLSEFQRRVVKWLDKY